MMAMMGFLVDTYGDTDVDNSRHSQPDRETKRGGGSNGGLPLVLVLTDRSPVGPAVFFYWNGTRI